MECYNCRNHVHEEDARTIGQFIVVCPACYRQLRSLIFNGYFDVPRLEDELSYEREVQSHLNAWA